MNYELSCFVEIFSRTLLFCYFFGWKIILINYRLKYIFILIVQHVHNYFDKCMWKENKVGIGE